MKKLILILVVVLVAAVPAQAATSLTLSVKQARWASRENTKLTIGTLLDRSIGTAPVSVGRCVVSGRRGRCAVRVNGTSRCSYISHVLRMDPDKTNMDYLVWGTNLRCEQ